MKVKEHIWELIRATYIGFLVILMFILSTVLLVSIWFGLAKYFDYLLGVFPESLFLTITTFCGSIFTLIAGVSTYVSRN